MLCAFILMCFPHLILLKEKITFAIGKEKIFPEIRRFIKISSSTKLFFSNDSFFTNLMSTFFILIHLLYSPTCFEHYYAHLQEDKLY